MSEGRIGEKPKEYESYKNYKSWGSVLLSGNQIKVAQVSGLKENVKVWERQWDFDDLFYDVFEYYGTSFMCTVYMYVCILVYAKLVYLLSFILIIVYCDSVSVNQDWFVMSVENDLNGGIRWFGINFKFFRCSLSFIFIFSRI